MKEKIENRGGARKGAGRKPKFENPTTLNFKIETDIKLKLKEKYGKKLNILFNQWVESLLK